MYVLQGSGYINCHQSNDQSQQGCDYQVLTQWVVVSLVHTSCKSPTANCESKFPCIKVGKQCVPDYLHHVICFSFVLVIFQCRAAIWFFIRDIFSSFHFDTLFCFSIFIDFKRENQPKEKTKPIYLDSS